MVKKLFIDLPKTITPLPSDNINDIEIDGVSGEVFFANR